MQHKDNILITNFRDVAAHSYDTINMDDLYITIKEDFPELKDKMSKLLK